MSHVCDGSDPTCRECRERAPHHETIRAAMTLDDRLDDIKRAQIWARLEDRLTGVAPGRWRPRWSLAILGGLAASAAVIALVVTAVRAPSPPAGAGRTLIAPSDTTLTLRLGEHTQAALIGPGRLDVVDAPAGASTTVVRLDGGTLLGELAGGHGRALRITTADATIEIVGTLFAVEARAHATCVSVAHGTVAMTTARRRFTITGGLRACSDADGLGAIDAATRDALMRHAVVIAAAGDAVARQRTAPQASAPTGDAIAPTDRDAERSRAAAAAGQAAISPAGGATTASPLPDRARSSATTRTSAAPTGAAVRGDAARPSVVAEQSDAGSRPPVPAIRASVTASSRDVAEPSNAGSRPPVPAIRASVTASPRDVARPVPRVASPPAAVSATSLYHDAETALGKRDLTAADRSLAQLVAEFPESALLDQALYERARIAYQRHAWRDAQRQLDKLSTIMASPLAEPGAYLACRIAVAAGDGDAERCLVAYRAAYPASPHDRDVMGWLAELAFRSGGCALAGSRIAVLARSYPDTALARDWRARCPETP